LAWPCPSFLTSLRSFLKQLCSLNSTDHKPQRSGPAPNLL
jgi:hypothetical protein